MFLTPLYWQALLFRLCRVYVFKDEFRAILSVPGQAVEAEIAGLNNNDARKMLAER
jgi:hypothetical protein